MRAASSLSIRFRLLVLLMQAFGVMVLLTVVLLLGLFALAINSTGHTSVRTVALLTPEEIDAAAKQTVHYTPPGA